MKKKIVSLITALACASTCAVALIACGGGNDSNSGTSVNATVTEKEWKDAIEEVKLSNLTCNLWRYKEAVMDINDVAAGRQDPESTETFKSAKKGSENWVYIKDTYAEPESDDSLRMFKVLFRDSGLSTSGGTQYSYEPDISKWTQETLDDGRMDIYVSQWANSYNYNALMGFFQSYEEFTYDKSAKLYRYGSINSAYELKFNDKKLVSFTYKATDYSYELCDFGTTVIEETPTEFATLAQDAIGKTFRLTAVEACASNNYPSTDTPSTDQAALATAEQFKTNIGKTAACKDEPTEVNGTQMGGVLQGTCDFGNGAFDSLTGDNVLYWRASDVYLYSAKITVTSKDNTVKLSGRYSADVLTLYLNLSNGNYVKLTYSL